MGILFRLLLAVMALRFLQIPFSALITSQEQMPFYSKFSIVEAAASVAAAYLARWGLVAYAVSLVVLAVFCCLVHILYCRRNFPHIKISMPVRISEIASIGRFISWGTLGTAGNILKYQGTNIMLNICSGVAFNAAWKISIGIWTLLYGISLSFRQASSPLVFTAYAERSAEDFMRLVRMTVTASFFLAAVPAALLSIDVDGFLLFWIGDRSAPQLAMFVRCALVNFVFDAVSCPLTLAIDATGKVARYQAVSSTLSLLAFASACGLLAAGLPEWSTMAAVAFCNGLACAYRFFHLRTLVLR